MTYIDASSVPKNRRPTEARQIRDIPPGKALLFLPDLGVSLRRLQQRLAATIYTCKIAGAHTRVDHEARGVWVYKDDPSC